MIANKKNYVLLGMIAFLSLFTGCGPDFKKDQNVLTRLLNESEDSLIQKIRSNEAAHEIQILYTQIQRDKEGNPIFKEFSFIVKPVNDFI